MVWLLFAFLSPILHGICNIIDNHFSNNIFKDISSLIFYATLTNLAFLPIVLIFGKPSFISLIELPYFVIVAITNLVYFIPYYKALQCEETSIVSALFSLGKIFVPVLAFIFIHEVLELRQYLAIVMIIFSSILLTINRNKRFKFNHSFYLMLLCTFILAIEAVCYKYLLMNLDFITTIVWSSVISFLLIMIYFLIVSNFRKSIKTSYQSYRNHWSLFILVEFFAFSGSIAFIYASSLHSISIVTAIGSSQAIFVLIYAKIFAKHFPELFKEKTDNVASFKKLVIYSIMIIGVILTL